MSKELYRVEAIFHSTTAPKGIIGNSEVTQTAHACAFDAYIQVRDMLIGKWRVEAPCDQMRMIDPNNLGEDDTRSSMEVMLAIDSLGRERARETKAFIEYNVPSYYKYSVAITLG